jgi:hypothetical protein
MSYHILHQFDEQWVADNSQEPASSRGRFFRSRNRLDNERENSRAGALDRPWLIVAASLIIAAFALYFAMDARRQTLELQQRLINVETRMK